MSSMYATFAKKESGYEANNKHTVKLTEEQIWAIIDMMGAAKDLRSDDPARTAWMVLIGQVTGNA